MLISKFTQEIWQQNHFLPRLCHCYIFSSCARQGNNFLKLKSLEYFHTTICKHISLQNIKALSMVPLKYLKIYFIITQCCLLGPFMNRLTNSHCMHNIWSCTPWIHDATNCWNIGNPLYLGAFLLTEGYFGRSYMHPIICVFANLWWR